MVFVKVRETYDLHTLTNKMSLIGIHTPDADIIQKNFPGLLMQCKCYRPASCDVRLACASVLPVDPLQVSTTSGDIAPEDMFNPLLYTACSNQGMSQIEARVNAFRSVVTPSIITGNTADVEVDGISNQADEFNLYYGLLSDAHQFRHASPQAGLSMSNIKPIVFEMLYTSGDNSTDGNTANISNKFTAPDRYGNAMTNPTARAFRGNSKPMPFINCTSYTLDTTNVGGTAAASGFVDKITNCETFTPAPRIYVGCIIVPPSRLHQLFYRMVVEWTLEFTGIRPIGELTDWVGLAAVGAATHYMSYDYSQSKNALGIDSETMDKDTSMVSADVDINKVM